jgi:ATP phosphoribosyltransferase-like protein
MDDPGRRARIEELVMLLRSVLDARRRVMVEVNVGEDRLEAVVAVLPCMREPTIATLHDGKGYAVKAAVPKEVLPSVIPRIKAAGGSDLVVSRLDQIIP